MKNFLLSVVFALMISPVKTETPQEKSTASEDLLSLKSLMFINMEELEQAALKLTGFANEMQKINKDVKQAEEEIERIAKKLKSQEGLSETAMKKTQHDLERATRTYQQVVQKAQEKANQLQTEYSIKIQKIFKELFEDLQKTHRYTILLNTKIIVDFKLGELKDLTAEAIQSLEKTHRKTLEDKGGDEEYKPKKKKGIKNEEK